MTSIHSRLRGVAGGAARDSMTNTLGDALPKEQARVREVLGRYKEIGPVGAFGAAMIEEVLRRADVAIISGDLVAMISVFKELQEITD